MNVFELCIFVKQWYMYILNIRYIVSLNSCTVSGILMLETSFYGICTLSRYYEELVIFYKSRGGV